MSRLVKHPLLLYEGIKEIRLHELLTSVPIEYYVLDRIPYTLTFATDFTSQILRVEPSRANEIPARTSWKPGECLSSKTFIESKSPVGGKLDVEHWTSDAWSLDEQEIIEFISLLVPYHSDGTQHLNSRFYLHWLLGPTRLPEIQ